MLIIFLVGDIINDKKLWMEKYYIHSKFTVISSTDEDKNKELDLVNRITMLNQVWE